MKVYGEDANVIKEEGSYMLAETKAAFYILIYDADRKKWIPVQEFSKARYGLDEATQEFEDFVRV